jgi:hypothetical protein
VYIEQWMLGRPTQTKRNQDVLMLMNGGPPEHDVTLMFLC